MTEHLTSTAGQETHRKPAGSPAYGIYIMSKAVDTASFKDTQVPNLAIPALHARCTAFTWAKQNSPQCNLVAALL